MAGEFAGVPLLELFGVRIVAPPAHLLMLQRGYRNAIS
jgi:hypothetical protein